MVDNSYHPGKNGNETIQVCGGVGGGIKLSQTSKLSILGGKPIPKILVLEYTQKPAENS